MRKAVLAGVLALWLTTATGLAAIRKVPSEYPRIQAAIDASEAGDVVVVALGVYYETINFSGKDIVVTSTDPNDPKVVGYTIINADGDGTTVTFENGETPAAVLTGFTITGGFGTFNNALPAPFKIFWGGGIYCNGGSPTITRNIIANNQGPVEMSGNDTSQLKLCYGGGISCLQSDAVISRNIIRGNRGYAGGGVVAYFGTPKIVDNLIFDNSATVAAGVLMVQGQLVNNTIVANHTGVGVDGGPGGNVYAADISDPNHINIITLCDHPARQYDPAISGRWVVWTDERNDRGDIYGADLSDWQGIRQFEVIKAPGTQQQPTVDGSLIAYADGRAAGGSIRLACVTYRHGVLDAAVPSLPLAGAPALDGRTLIWMDGYHGVVQGLTLGFSYSVPDGRAQNSRTGKRYDYIRHAITDANEGDQIVASADRYEEKISFAGKAVTVRSTDPNDPAVVETTVLAGSGNIVSFVGGEGAGSVLNGFTITGGNQGIVCYSTSPTITRCTVRGSGQAGIRLYGPSSPAITRCQVVANGAAGIEMSGIGEGRTVKLSDPTIRNCIVAANGGPGVRGGKPKLINCTVVENLGVGISGLTPTITNSIVYFNGRSGEGIQIDGTRAVVTYSDVQGGREGQGNIDADPLFVESGRWTDPSNSTHQVPALNGRLGWTSGDYHLKSQGWRWNAQECSWVSDEATSPCIDAGDPASSLFDEPLRPPQDTGGVIVNKQIDMGAYGGTAEASLAPANQ